METPSSDVLAELYSAYGYTDDSLPSLPPFIFNVLEELVATFEPFRGTGRLLDVGFGAGSLLATAKRHGWKTFGVEASESAVTSGRVNEIGELTHGDFSTAPFPAESFDVVSMQELVEHLPDPDPFLRRAREVLRPGGLLYLATPHGRGVSGRLLGPTWSVLKPPEHLQLYSARSIKARLERAGFERIDVFTQGLLPHEIVARARSRLAPPRDVVAREPIEAFTEKRNAGAYRVNAALTGSQVGRLAKAAVNRALRLTALGDSLRVYATK